jgi:hypothetical protein
MDKENADSLLRQVLGAEDNVPLIQDATMSSGYSRDTNVYLGCGRLFNEVTAKAMIPSVYGRTWVMSLFYQASLRFYHRQIIRVTENVKIEAKGSDYKKTQGLMSELRTRFAYFTNIFWIDDVTSLPQGKEVFKLQQQVLGLEKEHDLVKRKMESMDDILQSQHRLLMYKKSSKFNFLMILMTLVITGFIAVEVLGIEFFTQWLPTLGS